MENNNINDNHGLQSIYDDDDDAYQTTHAI